MKVLQADFVKSAARPSDWPKEEAVEIAFCGRSNVGKSSLLNTILGRKGMARVSRTPGRTRLLNFFHIEVTQDTNPSLVRAISMSKNPTPSRSDAGSRLPGATATSKKPSSTLEFTLVDLPGFGYAQVSKTERFTWRPLIESYLTGRTSLQAVILLFDSRRVATMKEDPLQLAEEEDLFFYLRSLGKQVLPVVTKADKLSKHERKPALAELRKRLGTKPLLFSAQTQEGITELKQHLLNLLSPNVLPTDDKRLA